MRNATLACLSLLIASSISAQTAGRSWRVRGGGRFGPLMTGLAYDPIRDQVWVVDGNPDVRAIDRHARDGSWLSRVAAEIHPKSVARCDSARGLPSVRNDASIVPSACDCRSRPSEVPLKRRGA